MKSDTPSVARVDVPALVSALRAALGSTQEQFAQRLEVTFSTVNCWENGKHRPHPAFQRRLLELAKELGVRVPQYSAGGARGRRGRSGR